MMIQRLLWPLTRLGAMFDEYERANASAQRLANLLDEQPHIQSKPNAQLLNADSVGISFNDVHFSYRSGTPILDGLSFSIPAGKTVGLAGFTGAGNQPIKCLLRL